MKKLFLIIYIFIFSFALCQEQGRYLYGDPECFYDLNTYKYDKTHEKYFIDTIIDVTAGGDAELIKSPYDKNDIFYIILETQYNKKTNSLKAKYKGFVSGNMILKNNDLCLTETKFYYNNDKKIYPDAYIYENNFSNIKSSNREQFKDYIQDMQKFYKLQQQGMLFKIEGIKNSLNYDCE